MTHHDQIQPELTMQEAMATIHELAGKLAVAEQLLGTLVLRDIDNDNSKLADDNDRLDHPENEPLLKWAAGVDDEVHLPEHDGATGYYKEKQEGRK